MRGALAVVVAASLLSGSTAPKPHPKPAPAPWSCTVAAPQTAGEFVAQVAWSATTTLGTATGTATTTQTATWPTIIDSGTTDEAVLPQADAQAIGVAPDVGFPAFGGTGYWADGVSIALCGRAFALSHSVLVLSGSWWQAQNSPTEAILGNAILFDYGLSATFDPTAQTVTFTQLATPKA